MYVSIKLDNDELLPSILGLEEGVYFPRFREAGVYPPHLIVRTRSGGGNREGYEEEIEKLKEHELYVNDDDCDYDSTYMYFEFTLPPFENLPESTKDEFKEAGIINWSK